VENVPVTALWTVLGLTLWTVSDTVSDTVDCAGLYGTLWSVDCAGHWIVPDTGLCGTLWTLLDSVDCAGHCRLCETLMICGLCETLWIVPDTMDCTGNS
jgi:hypothetical protein